MRGKPPELEGNSWEIGKERQEGWGCSATQWLPSCRSTTSVHLAQPVGSL